MSQVGPFLGGLQCIQACYTGECRGRGWGHREPFVEVEAASRFGPEESAELGEKGRESVIWSEQLHAWQSMAFGTPLKVSRYSWTSFWPQLVERLWRCDRPFGEIPCHTNTMPYPGTFGPTHESVSGRRRGPPSRLGKRRGIQTSKWQRRRAIGRSQ